MKMNVRVNMQHPTGERHRGGYGFTREWIVVDVDEDAAADILADPYLETGDGGDVEVVTELPTAPDAPAPDVAPAAPDAPAPVAPKPAPKPRKRATRKPKK